MSCHPYSNLPDTRFWSSGVASPVSEETLLTIDPLIKSLSISDSVVSGGSCFAQYIGKELISRKFDYLRSQLSDERVESFGLGNIYTIAQLRQWLEFSLGQRIWGDACSFEKGNQWYDFLLPHRSAVSSRVALLKHRLAVKDEMMKHLESANVLIFTIGLTETWRNSVGDVYPTCPGTLVGDFDESAHYFHNCTFDEIYADLGVVESLLAIINPSISMIYTVSPVPLTATASDEHVLMATTYSKSVIRAAIGQHCHHSKRASYFPSYELINHHMGSDWRFSENLRSVSEPGVRYVMRHAFACSDTDRGAVSDIEASSVNCDSQEAACEEELLDSYSKSIVRASRYSDVIIVGDSHMGKLATGFETAGVTAIGGMVMNGSGFSDGKFQMSEAEIFTPLEDEKSQEIWSQIHNRLKSQNGNCHVITNIGFQTHRTINAISNHFSTPVLTESDVASYFENNYEGQVQILRQLTRFGKVWLVEDPDFYAFLAGKDTAMTIRDKNFHQYSHYLRKLAVGLGIEYLNPCDAVLQDSFKDSSTLSDLIGPDGFHGTQKYYEHCATVINALIRQ